MTILAEIQEVVAEIGAPEMPSSVFGTAGVVATTLAAHARQAGLETAFGPLRAGPRVRWAALSYEHEFSTVAGQTKYPLPADFEAFIDNTAWDRGRHWHMRGSLTPQLWQLKRSGLVRPGLLAAEFRITGDAGARVFELLKAPGEARPLVLEYNSDAWVQGADSTPKAAPTRDDDLLRIKPRLFRLSLTWRLKKRFGEPYAEDRDDFEDNMIQELGRDVIHRTINLTGAPAGRPRLLQDFVIEE